MRCWLHFSLFAFGFEGFFFMGEGENVFTVYSKLYSIDHER